MYDKIKRYYDTGLWTLEMVRNVVAKGKITAEEYQTITGEAYQN
jgi:uncharacterized XkdX family phage protein